MGKGDKTRPTDVPRYMSNHEKAYGIDCSCCHNQGYLTGEDQETGYVELMECPFCHNEPNSKFNRRKERDEG